MAGLFSCFYFLPFFPLIAGWLLSFWKPMYLPGRYDSIFQALFVIMICTPLKSNSPGRRWGPLLFAFLLIFQVVFTGDYLINYAKSNDRDVGEFISAQNPGPGDMAITCDLSQTPLEYYLGCTQIRIRPFPESERGWLPRAYLEGRPDFVNEEIAKLEPELNRLSSESRIFLMLSQDLPGLKDLQQYLDNRFSVISSQGMRPVRRYNQVREVRIYLASPENNRTSTP